MREVLHKKLIQLMVVVRQAIYPTNFHCVFFLFILALDCFWNISIEAAAGGSQCSVNLLLAAKVFPKLTQNRHDNDP